MKFEPDYQNILQVLNNQQPARLPLYEHHIDAPFISKILGEHISSQGLKNIELEDYYRKVIGFWKDMTYDAFDFEAAICDILPGHGAIMGQFKQGKISLTIHGTISQKYFGKPIPHISRPSEKRCHRE
jgi:hypothetical protein